MTTEISPIENDEISLKELIVKITLERERSAEQPEPRPHRARQRRHHVQPDQHDPGR